MAEAYDVAVDISFPKGIASGKEYAYFGDLVFYRVLFIENNYKKLNLQFGVMSVIQQYFFLLSR